MLRKRALWISLIVLALVIGSGAFITFRTIYLPSREPSPPAIATAQVRRGDVVLSVSGLGTLYPASQVDLGFQSGGYVDQVLVEAGDHVQEGALLASLETNDLVLAVTEADLKARQAQLDLAEACEGATAAELGDARVALQGAQVALAVAQSAYENAENSDLDAAVRAALIHYQAADARYQGLAQGSASAAQLEEAWKDRASAEAALNNILHQAETEELSAWNQVDQAQNRVYQAQERLNTLQDGPAEDVVLRAQLKADQAALALENARANLEAAQLRAPFDGIVVDVTAIPGEQVGTAPIITLIDLAEPLLCLWVDESDLSGVAVDNRVEIVFEALPDDIFTGEVVRVEPALVTVDRTLAVQAWASVDLTAQTASLLVGGLNADVEIISAESRDTLLVPVQALRGLGSGQYAVFVVRPDGELELNLVEVGLQDLVNAEILSGLELGEVVSIGEQEETSVTVPQQTELPGERPMSFPGEGPVFVGPP